MATSEDLVTFGDYRHLASLGVGGLIEWLLVIIDSFGQAIVRSSCARLSERSRRATLVECLWLVGVYHLSC
jgi:hypothetical protein